VITTGPGVDDDTVAVATPDTSVVHGPELNVPVPDVMSKNTFCPDITLPKLSRTVAVTVDVLEPSATTLAGEASNNELLTDGSTCTEPIVYR
jgi:hypothetical protein